MIELIVTGNQSNAPVTTQYTHDNDFKQLIGTKSYSGKLLIKMIRKSDVYASMIISQLIFHVQRPCFAYVNNGCEDSINVCYKNGNCFADVTSFFLTL